MATADYLNYRGSSGGVTGKIHLFDSPTIFDGNTVPIRKNGRTLYACYGDANDSRASPINCKVNGETKRILVSPIVDGSINVGTFKSYSFTAPDACEVVEIVGTTYNGDSDDRTAYGYFGKVLADDSWTPTTAIAGVWTNGNGKHTVYVSVTSGKTYTLYGRWVRNVTISYGTSINEQTAQFSWD